MFKQSVIVPLNVGIVLPALASIRVNEAKTLHVTPDPVFGSVSIAFIVASSEVKSTIEPVREVKQLNAVVMV